MKREFILLGSDNFWYASGLKSMKEVKERIQDIIKHPQHYTDPESGRSREEVPETFYVYKETEVAQCDMTESKWWKELEE